MLIRGYIIEENKFCSMEGEHALDKVEGEPAVNHEWVTTNSKTIP